MSSSWSLSKQSFDLLLRWLSEDRTEAAARYEIQRLKLIRILENRGALDPEALADEVFNRVCRRLEEGTVDVSVEPSRFLYGVAKVLLLESAKRRSVSGVFPMDHSRNAVAEKEIRLTAMEKCLASMDPEDLRILTRYTDGSGAARIEARARLANEMGLSPGALRIKVARIRKAVADCVVRRMEEMERNEAAGGAKY